MHMIFLALAMGLALASSAVLAQPSPTAAGDTIGHPPPLPSPPSAAEPSTAEKPTTTSPEANAPALKGYTGAYAPPGTPPIPYSTGPLPLSTTGPGLNTVGPDGVSTKTVKAVPCGRAARETDGFTTCVGISDEGSRGKGRR